MFTEFWDKIGEELGSKWAAQRLGPLLAFWGGGLLAWMWHAGWGWQQIEARLTALNAPAAYLALTVGGLFLLAASAAVMSRLQLLVLRLLEGYWPWPLRRLRFGLARRRAGKLDKKESRWNELSNIALEAHTAEQKSEYVRLDAELAHYPVDRRNLLPTAVGNTLRAAEEYPQVRYGLEMSVCWPRLWLLLPQGTQETLAQARQRLDDATRLFAWGVLFAVWAVWAWWAVPVALVTALAAYWAVLQAARLYGELLRAAFDLHRFALYEQLRFPLPATLAEELASGHQLSEYLFRGSSSDGISFTHSTQHKPSTPSEPAREPCLLRSLWQRLRKHLTR